LQDSDFQTEGFDLSEREHPIGEKLPKWDRNLPYEIVIRESIFIADLDIDFFVAFECECTRNIPLWRNRVLFDGRGHSLTSHVENDVYIGLGHRAKPRIPSSKSAFFGGNCCIEQRDQITASMGLGRPRKRQKEPGHHQQV
jgi:hypothetical protein